MNDVYKCPVCGQLTESPTHCGVSAVKILDGAMRLKISKLLSLALRHSPSVLGLSLDKGGWADVKTALEGLRKAGIRADYEALYAVVALDEKGRFELKDGKIRARYGHTIDVEVEYEADSESKALYHGTSRHLLPSIMAQGLLPMRRRYVHLSPDFATACQNARRRPLPVVIEIDAECLRARGYVVYAASGKVRLAKHVPPECLKKVVDCPTPS